MYVGSNGEINVNRKPLPAVYWPYDMHQTKPRVLRIATEVLRSTATAKVDGIDNIN